MLDVDDTTQDDSAATSDIFLLVLLPFASASPELLLSATTLVVWVLLSQLLFVEPSAATPFFCVDKSSEGLLSPLFTCVDDDGGCDADDEDGLSVNDTCPFSALELEHPPEALAFSVKAPLSVFELYFANNSSKGMFASSFSRSVSARYTGSSGMKDTCILNHHDHDL